MATEMSDDREQRLLWVEGDKIQLRTHMRWQNAIITGITSDHRGIEQLTIVYGKNQWTGDRFSDEIRPYLQVSPHLSLLHFMQIPSKHWTLTHFIDFSKECGESKETIQHILANKSQYNNCFEFYSKLDRDIESGRRKKRSQKSQRIASLLYALNKPMSEWSTAEFELCRHLLQKWAIAPLKSLSKAQKKALSGVWVYESSINTANEKGQFGMRVQALDGTFTWFEGPYHETTPVWRLKQDIRTHFGLKQDISLVFLHGRHELSSVGTLNMCGLDHSSLIRLKKNSSFLTFQLALANFEDFRGVKDTMDCFSEKLFEMGWDMSTIESLTHEHMLTGRKIKDEWGFARDEMKIDGMSDIDWQFILNSLKSQRQRPIDSSVWHGLILEIAEIGICRIIDSSLDPQWPDMIDSTSLRVRMMESAQAIMDGTCGQLFEVKWSQLSERDRVNLCGIIDSNESIELSKQLLHDS